jgi:RNA polymerase sigma factor (sigma-70 family)
VRPRFSFGREPFACSRDFQIVDKILNHDLRADELLAIRCQLGERDAFDALIARWHGPLWRYLRRMSGSDAVAHDLTQDTWLRVLRGLGGLRDATRLRPWLFGIARRVAMDRLRDAYARRVEDDSQLEHLAAAEPDMALEFELAGLDRGLASLPAREREVLALFYLRELSIEQMAGLLEVPAGTIKSRLFRARQMLRQQLETQES